MNSELSVYNTDSASLSDEYIPSVGKYGVFTARKATGNLLIVEWHTPLNGNGTRAGDYTGTYRSTSTPPWSGWAPVAMAEPPQEYDLPLSDGLEVISGGRGRYFKTQDNVVTISCNIKSNYDITGTVTIGTLPVGFRPSYLIKAPVLAVLSDNSVTSGFVDINARGVIQLYRIRGQVNELEISPVTFVAGS